MKNILQFAISHGNDGWYSASGIGVPVVTQGKTLDELARNIREAVDLHFGGDPTPQDGFSSTPPVMLNIELPETIHA